MAGPENFTFRLTAEGVVELKQQLEALPGAFDKIKQASPQLSDAFTRAQAQVDATREAIERAAAAAPRGLGRVGEVAANAERGVKGMVGSLRDVTGTLQLLGPITGGVGSAFANLVQTVGNVGDLFGTLSLTALRVTPALAGIGAVLAVVAAGFALHAREAKAAQAGLEQFTAATKAGATEVEGLRKQLDGLKFPSVSSRVADEAARAAEELRKVNEEIAKLDQGGTDPFAAAFGNSPTDVETARRAPRLGVLAERREALQKQLAEIEGLKKAIASTEGGEQDIFTGQSEAADKLQFERRKKAIEVAEAEAKARAEAAKQLTVYLATLEQDARLTLESNEERERQVALIKAEDLARQAGRALSDEERGTIIAMVDAKRMATEAQKQLTAELAEAQKVTDSVRTPIELYGAEINRLADLLERGAISQETFNRAVGQAQEKLATATKETAELTEEQKGAKQAAGDFTRTISRGFEDAVVRGKGFREVLQGIVEDLGRIAIRIGVTKPLENSLTGILGPILSPAGMPTIPNGSAGGSPAGDGGGIMGGAMGGGGGFGSALGGIASFVGSLFSFKDGGIMTPSGPMKLRSYAGGGIATEPTLAMVRDGGMNEAMIPLPDGHRVPVDLRGGGNTTVNFHVHGVENPDQFMRSRRQWEGGLVDAISRARAER